jgi:hypothetical protein
MYATTKTSTLEPRGAAIPGSRLLRDYCTKCHEPIRVQSIRESNSCHDCGNSRGQPGRSRQNHRPDDWYQY